MSSTANLNDKDTTKVTSKNVEISEKILNGPLMSDENNESLRNDKVKSKNFTIYISTSIEQNVNERKQNNILHFTFCDDVAELWR